jgi:hypothetical protein
MRALIIVHCEGRQVQYGCPESIEIDIMGNSRWPSAKKVLADVLECGFVQMADGRLLCSECAKREGERNDGD